MITNFTMISTAIGSITLLLGGVSIGLYKLGYKACERSYYNEYRQEIEELQNYLEKEYINSLDLQELIREKDNENKLLQSDLDNFKYVTCDFVSNDFSKLFNKIHKQ